MWDAERVVMPREGGASSTLRLPCSIAAVSGILGHPPSRVTTSECEFAISRHALSEVCIFVSPLRKTEGAGKTGCALHPRSRVQTVRKNAHEHTGSAETLRPSLRNGFTAYFVLSPVNGFLATVAGGIPRSIQLDRCAPADLTPAPRRQDHTTSPYASGAYVSYALRVHRISPRVRDVRTPIVR